MVVIRGQPKGGPPPERTIALSYIVAPKLGRRSNPGGERSSETKDEVSETAVLLHSRDTPFRGYYVLELWT